MRGCRRRDTASARRRSLINQLVQFRLLRLHLDRLADIVTAVPETETATVPRLEVKGAIKVRELSFRYGVADQLVLQDVDFEVAPGEFVAITGPSGGGKTTFLKLLLGLHQPTSGTIDLDGRRADPELWRAWRAHVGVVSQDDRLLSGTIADKSRSSIPTSTWQRCKPPRRPPKSTTRSCVRRCNISV